jgi:hypothetical protein
VSKRKAPRGKVVEGPGAARKSFHLTKAEVVWWSTLQAQRQALERQFGEFWGEVGQRVGVEPGTRLQLTQVDGRPGVVVLPPDAEAPDGTKER